MSAVEDRWLDYAWDVVSADEQTAADVAHGGGCVNDDDAPHLRWPGYLGARYERARVLLAGNVHTRFDSNGVAPHVARDLVAATHRWRRQPRARDDYLRTTRAAYLEGLSGSPRWTVAGPFSTILDELGLDWGEVAYTNGSKSQLTQGTTAPLVKAGLARFPMSRLARDVLDARLVITCSAPVRDHLQRAGVPVAYWRQMRWSRQDVLAAAQRSKQLLAASG